MQELNLGNNEINDISVLAKMPKMQRLFLNNNQISDISALANLTELIEINLGYNMVFDMGPLSRLLNLQKLSLNENRLTNINSLATLTELVELNLNHINKDSKYRYINDVGWEKLTDEQKRTLSSFKNIYVNGALIDFPDQKPFIDNTVNRTYVPVRFVSSALGLETNWKESVQKVEIVKGNKQIGMSIGVKSIDVNGKVVPLNVPPLLVNNRTVVPLRITSEGMGAKVAWIPEGSGGRIDISI